MSCYRYEGTHYLRTRHIGACDGTECAGCELCGERHCGCRTHLRFGEQTCPGCVGKTRTDLRDLVDLYAALPAEAMTRGVDSEAANLNGPATDAEAWSYRKAAMSLRIHVPMSSLEPDDEYHPLSVLGRWVFMLGEDYGDPTDLKLTMSRAVDYLDRRLGRIAHDAGQDWCLFAAEIRRCKAHMESVLHDSKLPERSRVPCLDCGTLLVVVYAVAAKDDHHRCPRCPRDYNAEEFARAKAQWLASEGAERYVLLADAVKAVERPEFTIRTWIRRGVVSAVCDVRTHRLQVWWPHVRDAHKARRVEEVKPKAG